jgi:nuclear pore complex protein Nup133
MLLEGKLLVANAVVTSRSVDKEGRAEADRTIQQTEDLIDDYFDRPGFGDVWAEVYFTFLLRESKAVRILDRFSMQRKFVARFFASKPQYAKISWMNNVLNEHSYERAGQELLYYQKDREADVWSKKVELSLGRLSLLADWESQQPESVEVSQALDSSEVPQPAFVQSFVAINAQEQLRDSIAPLVESALDDTAAVHLVLESRGKIAVKGKPKLATLLEESVAHMVDCQVLSKDQLVNALTLLDGDLSDEADDFGMGGAEYFKALEVLNADPDAYALDEIPKSVYEMIVWRRCMLRDDWEELNLTEEDDDRAVMARYEGTSLYETLRLGYLKGVLILLEWPSRWHADIDSGFWDAETGKTRPVRPIDVLEAGCTPESLGTKLDLEVREALARDLSLEASQLNEQIQRGRLDDLFDGLDQYAKESIDRSREETAVLASQLVDFEQAMRVKPLPVWISDDKPGDEVEEGDQVQVNGYHADPGDEVMGEARESIEKADGDGDISMYS